MKKELNIPIAHRVKMNDLILPSKATKEDGPFECPNCHEQVILRKASQRCRTHFSHIANETNVSCSANESLMHKAAKHIVATYPTYFHFQEKCTGCKKKCLSPAVHLKGQQIGTVEFRIGAYVVDVATHDDQARLTSIVEIRHTHPIEAKKWDALHESTKNVFEVRAADIVESFDPKLEYCVVGCARQQASFCESCAKKHAGKCRVCSEVFLRKSMHLCRQSSKYICSKCIADAKICKECNSDVCDGDLTVCCFCKSDIDQKVELCERNYTFINMLWLQQLRERHDLVYSIPNNFALFILRRKLRRCLPGLMKKRERLWCERKAARKRQLLDGIAQGTARFDLGVFYEDKDIARKCGCHWDASSRKWYVVGKAIFNCICWLPMERQLHPVSKRVCYRSEDREILKEEHPCQQDLFRQMKEHNERLALRNRRNDEW